MSEERCPKCGAKAIAHGPIIVEFQCGSYKEKADEDFFSQSLECNIKELRREAWIWKRAFEMATPRTWTKEALCRSFIESDDPEAFECPFPDDTDIECGECFAMWLPQMAEAEWEERNGNQPGEK